MVLLRHRPKSARCWQTDRARMSNIDPTARIESGATIADGVKIGPYCIVGSDVSIAAGTHLVAHVIVTGHTSIGSNCVIHPFASLGSPPQDLGYRGEPTQLEIGNDCIIRESVTMNVGSLKGGGLTKVGDRGIFMAYSHVGHDCQVGDDAIFANSATLGGHCLIGNSVYIGGLTAVHQFVRIGTQAMVAGMTGVRGDVIPFGFATGQHAHLEGLNVIGMKRRKFSRERLHKMRAFYNDLFHGAGLFDQRLAALQGRAGDDSAIADILAFIEDGKKRPLCKAVRGADED